MQDGKTVVVSASEPESAYLGLKLWDRSIDDAEFSIMNIDDFLKENNLSVDDEAIAPQSPSGIDVDTSLLRSEEPVVTSSLSNPRKLEDERKRTLGQKKKHTPLRTTDVLPKVCIVSTYYSYVAVHLSKMTYSTQRTPTPTFCMLRASGHVWIESVLRRSADTRWRSTSSRRIWRWPPSRAPTLTPRRGHFPPTS